jgi:enoyl-CoA hydratase
VANEVAIGMTMPWTAIEICRQRLAPAHFHRVLSLSEVYTPAEGVAAGLLDRVVAVDDLLPAATTLASTLGALDRRAHVSTKLRAREAALNAIRAGLEMDREGFQQMAAAGNTQT